VYTGLGYHHHSMSPNEDAVLWPQRFQMQLRALLQSLVEGDLRQVSKMQSDDISNARASLTRLWHVARTNYALAVRASLTDQYWAATCRFTAMLLAGIAVVLALGIDGRIGMWIALWLSLAMMLVLLIVLVVASKADQSRDRLYWDRRYWVVHADVDPGIQPIQPPPTTCCCPAESTVDAYQHCGFGGLHGRFGVGRYDLANTNELISEGISAFRVPPGLEVQVWKNQFSGPTLTLDTDTSCLLDQPEWWNDAVTSFEVRHKERQSRPQQQQQQSNPT